MSHCLASIAKNAINAGSSGHDVRLLLFVRNGKECETALKPRGSGCHSNLEGTLCFQNEEWLKYLAELQAQK